ncbi:beta-1,4-galactosyltransferase galt-1-like isoform X1 [Dreissena polymorpha]|nr:beta-1,4-galactosyltransferase galt-1-like isoform X1 [Dreissena polymorpha]XP_052269829.1 beta-1,4-galactosyltransferase galt-1-like isoform X1 [Dreissena polymorpha]
MYFKSKCSTNMKLNKDMLSQATWIPVDTSNSTFVFSAYYEHAAKHVVLVGLKSSEVVGTCQLWFAHGNGTFDRMEESALELYQDLTPYNGQRYVSYLFRCSSPNGQPAYASVVQTSCQQPSKLIVVKVSETPKSYKRKFTACLMPLFGNFSDAHSLVEWVELNLLLGAEKFFVYDNSSAENIRCVLKMYAERNIVEIVQWPIPVKDVHYVGQIAQLQDCLFRNKPESEFIVNVDMDEFIIPRKDNVRTWSDFVANSSSGAFIFRNTFFLKETYDENSSSNALAKQFKLYSLLLSKHEPKVWVHGQRSKYIARTSMVTWLRVHDVLQSSSQIDLVSEDQAMLFHYRYWENKNVNTDNFVTDETVIRKYGETLVANVKRTWTEIEAHRLKHCEPSSKNTS